MEKQFIEKVASVLYPFPDTAEIVTSALESGQLNTVRIILEDMLNTHVESLVRIIEDDEVIHHNTTVMLIKNLQEIHSEIENQLLRLDYEESIKTAQTNGVIFRSEGQSFE